MQVFGLSVLKTRIKKILVQWQSFANGTESGIYVGIVLQNAITSESFIIAWGIESPHHPWGPHVVLVTIIPLAQTPALSIFICPEPRICYII